MKTRKTTAIEEIFDLDWYSLKTKITFETKHQAIEHYRNSSPPQRNSCSPYLDEHYYLTINNDVAAAGLTALDHFVNHGNEEGRNPHPLIDTDYYRTVAQTKENILTHLLRNGESEERPTCKVFMYGWYSIHYQVKCAPLLHYILNGSDPSYTPNPAFEPRFVQKQLAVDEGRNIYCAYACCPNRMTLIFHEIFDYGYYRNLYSLHEARLRGSYENLFEEFIDSPLKADPNPIFSRSYYKERANDLKLSGNEFSQFLTDDNQYNDPHPFFSTKYYYSQRPDVWKARENALKHFYLGGFAEGSDPHPLFSCNEYYAVNNDVKISNTNPLAHYLKHGRYERRRLRQIEHIVSTARRLEKYVPYELASASTLTSDGAASKTVGAFIHIYYAELCEEIISYTNNLPENSHIYVSTTSSEKAYRINSAFLRNSKHKFVVKVFENRGRDLASMLVGFNRELLSVDLALHLHTKKSKHYHNGFDEWRKYLLTQNCGSVERITSIISALSDERVGAIAPMDFPAIEKIINWGGNIQQINKLMGLMSNNEFSIDTLNKLELPSGSMFWFKPTALKPLLDLNLPFDSDFPDATAGNADAGRHKLALAVVLALRRH